MMPAAPPPSSSLKHEETPSSMETSSSNCGQDGNSSTPVNIPKNDKVSRNSESDPSKMSANDRQPDQPLKSSSSSLSSSSNPNPNPASSPPKRPRSEDINTETRNLESNNGGEPLKKIAKLDLSLSTRDGRAKDMEANGTITFEEVTNDRSPRACMLLLTAKDIFAAQLPKMPKDYIVRLVLDRKHKTLCMFNKGKVCGCVCYRPCYPQRFAEIVFLAIDGADQVRGFGSRLMNHLKQLCISQGLDNFLTYADNYAIGYFRKQGFTKSISMPQSRWMGYIKDYDGGTLMECVLNAKVNYLELGDMLSKQRRAILEKIAKNSTMHNVRTRVLRRRGSDALSSTTTSVATTAASALQEDVSNRRNIPGLIEAGWGNAESIRETLQTKRQAGTLRSKLRDVWKDLRNAPNAEPFLEPVNLEEVPDYTLFVSDPMDLKTIGERLTNDYYRTKEMFIADVNRMCENTRAYNGEESKYWSWAQELQNIMRKSLTKFLE
eukprot:g4198.t1